MADLRHCAVVALLLSCGDNSTNHNRAPAQDAAFATPADAGLVDADTNTPVDAATNSDAVPSPDAVPGSSCASAIDLASGASHLGDTDNHNNSGGLSCSSGSSSSRDAVYRIALPSAPTDVLVSVIVDEGPDVAQPYDVVLGVLTECGAQSSEVACSDFGLSESLEALALTGEAFVQVDGTSQFGGSSSGSYQIDVRTRAIAELGETCDPALASSRCATGLRCVASACASDSATVACEQALPLVDGTDIEGSTFAFAPDHFQGSCAFDSAAGAGEQIFAFALAQSSDLLITTDLPRTDFDTVIYLLSACASDELACSDDIDPSASNFSSRLEVSALPAGSYLLVVDGSSPQAPTGRFGLRMQVSASL